ncbi:peptide ABC transporter substrate-binding protein [Pseudalkalibacillus berkeleyi]|uniref:Peptide ABC transporter substrate-binding protein n=1 Tax=Pseudalkalibacillus berkeleyi TaxID=1069813 RepID=A0ABS9H141_9BACL|nr:peptide ABC transporter substrate-binding protein [Pseudalkalibacillus berkeleyi]MCF6138722.1 peptide ABC transporter substrate-binding protein [Pseudalkalibacillus berkeleyi]
MFKQRRSEKKSIFTAFSLLLTLALVLAACAPGGGDGGGEGGEQKIRVNINTEPFSLNPGLANDTTSGGVLLQTFEGLTRIGKDGKPENAMAKDVKKSEDLKKYTFTIRDATWSNGDKVTAQDFEYAWKWAINPKNEAQYAYQLYYLKNGESVNMGETPVDQLGVKAIDEKTLEVTLENPTPYFLELTAFYTYFPVNSKIAKENPKWYTDAGENYTSNGPFVMNKWAHNDKIILKKNKEYWDAKAVNLEQIEMIMVNDPNTELSMFDNGELDWAGSPMGNLPTEAIPSLKDEKRLNIEPIAGTYWYKFNTSKKPFNNVNIRKAFAYSINREAIVNNITKGGQIPGMAAVPPTMIEENEKGYFKDNEVDEAKKLLEKGLKEEGYGSVADLPAITLSYNTDESHAKVAQAIQDMWKKNLGVNVKLSNAEWKVYIDKLHSGNYQIGRMGWLGDFNDPINFLELYKEKGGNNDTRWHNDEFASLLEKSATETDEKARLKMLKDAEEILMDEMPIAPIYFYTNTWVQNENLQDVVLSGLGDAQFKWASVK